jgi:hypothetical protein
MDRNKELVIIAPASAVGCLAAVMEEMDSQMCSAR